jgi:hypothetical protein
MYFSNMITNKKELRLYLEMDQNANGINYHGLKNKDTVLRSVSEVK